MTSKENVKNLYEVFIEYKLLGKIEKCPCGCISIDEELKIYSKELKKLEADDIGFYNRKAMTTWGNEDNYKHFLPRIIEIYKEDKRNSWIDLDTIYNKLSHANWKNWNLKEQEVINNFVKLDWCETINESETELWIGDFESYLNFFSFEELLKAWTFPKNKTSLKNFIQFIYENGYEIINNSKNDNSQVLLSILRERVNLKESLEEEFFKNEETNKEFSSKISIVLQMIENEVKNKTT